MGWSRLSREFVMLLEREPAVEEWTGIATEVIGGGNVIRFTGDLLHMIDSGGASVVSWWPARTIENTREAAAEVGLAAESRVWIDACVPAGDDGTGVTILQQVAMATGGTIMERGRS